MVSGQEVIKIKGFTTYCIFHYLWRSVINGDLDCLAGRADVDYHQNMAVIDLRGMTKWEQVLKLTDSMNESQDQ